MSTVFKKRTPITKEVKKKHMSISRKSRKMLEARDLNDELPSLKN